MARDIVLFNVFGYQIERATRDIDLAVHVADWNQFHLLKVTLVESGRFAADPNAIQHLMYDSIYPVDLLPFGGVAAEKKLLHWPPTQDTVMNIMGYEEALDHALEIQVSSDLVVSVASLASLAVLKVFAWLDRGAGNRKDALDLALVLRRYGETLGDELWAGSVLESVDYDRDRAGAILLGQHSRQILNEASAAHLLDKLGVPAVRDQLTTHVAAAFTHRDDRLQLAGRLLEDFCAGLSARH